MNFNDKIQGPFNLEHVARFCEGPSFPPHSKASTRPYPFLFFISLFAKIRGRRVFKQNYIFFPQQFLSKILVIFFQ